MIHVKPKKLNKFVKFVELGEGGATVTLITGTKILLTKEELGEMWGLLTLALDAATLGQLSSSVRRNGIWPSIQDALDMRKIPVDDRQMELPTT